MYQLVQLTLIFLLPFTLPLTTPLNQPHCTNDPNEEAPKFSDCIDVISYVERQVSETGNRLFTASRRQGSNIHLPNLFWDHLPGSTCGVRLDMVIGREDSHDELRMSDIAFAGQKVMDACLSPGRQRRTTAGWMTAGKHGFVNITVEKLNWDRGFENGRWGSTLLMPGNGTVAMVKVTDTE